MLKQGCLLDRPNFRNDGGVGRAVMAGVGRAVMAGVGRAG